MKTLKTFVIFFSILFSCSNEQEIPKEIELNDINVELSLDFKKIDGVHFKTKNLSLFTSKFSQDFFLDTSFYMTISSDITIIKFSSEQINKVETNRSAKASSSTTCSTCRSQECVEKTIKDAFTNNDPTKGPVYIATKPVKTLGVTTGVLVCYSNTPIDVTKLAEIPIEITNDYIDELEDDGIVSIDELLEND